MCYLRNDFMISLSQLTLYCVQCYKEERIKLLVLSKLGLKRAFKHMQMQVLYAGAEWSMKANQRTLLIVFIVNYVVRSFLSQQLIGHFTHLSKQSSMLCS